MDWVGWILGAFAVVGVLVIVFMLLTETVEFEGWAAEAAACKYDYDADDIGYIETRLQTTGWDEFPALAKWWVEVLEGDAWREIGFDAASNAVVAAPSETNHDGYWNDAGATLRYFQEHDPSLREVSETDFEAAWDRFFEDD